MLFRIGALVLSGLMLAATANAVETKTVTMLDRGEPWDAMIYHADQLWVGHSRKQFNPSYKIETYATKGKMTATLAMPHSIVFMYPYGANSVMTVGVQPDKNSTVYSIVTLANGQLSAQSVRIPDEAWAHRWIGHFGDTQVFSDPGGNQNDPEGSENPSLPAMTLFAMNGRNVNYYTTRLRLPGEGMIIGDDMFVITSDSIGAMGSNLAKIDINSGEMTMAFPTKRKSLVALAHVPSLNAIVGAERMNGSLVIGDLKNSANFKEVATLSEPKTLATAGRCVVVGSYEDCKVQILRLNDDLTAKEVLSWDAGVSETEFTRLNKVAVDLANKTVFGRSNFACNPMTDPCAHHYNRVLAWSGKDIAAALAQCE
jgi:hypothetical protein